MTSKTNCMVELTNPRFYVEAEAAAILARLRKFFIQRGIEFYLVGGFVRDGLLGRSNSDIDLAVSGDAIGIASEVAQAFGGKMVLLDDVHQIARVVLPGAGGRWHLDLSAMRGGIEADLGCRDFTINAIALSLAEVKEGWSSVLVIDPLGGCRDLSHKLVRAVNENAFRHDPARLLRAVRFAAVLDFSVDPDTEALIRHDHALLTTVSGERLRDELRYLLETPKTYSALHHLDRLELLTSLIPELTATKGVAQPKEHFWDVFHHSLETVAAAERLLREQARGEREGEETYDELLISVPWSPEIVQHFAQEVGGGGTRRGLLKLAALLHDIAKPATKTIELDGRMRFLGHAREGMTVVGQIMERLRFSHREIRMVQLMVEHHLRPGQLSDIREMPSRRAIYRYFRDTKDVGIDTLFLSLADHLATRGPELDFAPWHEHAAVTQYMISKFFEEKAVVAPPKLIDGHILIARFGLSPGPQIGELLEAVREAHAAGEIKTAEQAIEFVARQLARG